MPNNKPTVSTDPKSRKFQLTINNPLDIKLPDPNDPEQQISTPFDHDEIKRRLGNLTSAVYWCMADEIGNEGHTPHTHIYLQGNSPIRFSTLKNQFPTAHIEAAYGSAKENRDYVLKDGKWKNTAKSETSVPDTFEEWGEPPMTERISSVLGGGGEASAIFSLVENGLSDAQILNIFPDAFLMIDKIQRLRQILFEEEARTEWRTLEVTYIFGPTNTGKTRSVMEYYSYASVYRVTDYQHPWDGYQSTEHDVVLFEEFRSSLPISDMLVYLDGYPCTLKARYFNRQANFTKVYFSTNIPLEDQYRNIQIDEPATWKAFLRRIHKVVEYMKDGSFAEYESVKEYFHHAKVQRFVQEMSDAEFTNLLNHITGGDGHGQ